MENPIEQINNIGNMDDFLNFLVQLAMDSKEHPEEWENTTITDYLGQMASWVDDCSAFDDTVDWEKVDYKTFAKILYKRSKLEWSGLRKSKQYKKRLFL